MDVICQLILGNKDLNVTNVEKGFNTTPLYEKYKLAKVSVLTRLNINPYHVNVYYYFCKYLTHVVG